MSWSTSELRVRLAPLNRFKPSSKIFYWPFQDGIFYAFVLSCVCYVFVRVYLYVLCGHLLGKGWPLGSRLWCLLWVCHFSIGILGQVWYLIVSIPDLCTLTYFVCVQSLLLVNTITFRWPASWVQPVRTKQRWAFGESCIISLLRAKILRCFFLLLSKVQIFTHVRYFYCWKQMIVVLKYSHTLWLSDINLHKFQHYDDHTKSWKDPSPTTRYITPFAHTTMLHQRVYSHYHINSLFKNVR